MSHARPTLLLAILLLPSLAACGGTAGSSPSGPVVEVAASEYAFAPDAITVARGPITFRVHNAGTAEHEFEVFRDETVVDEVEGLVPGLTRDLTLTLEPGEYTFACKLAAHDELGMTGTLTVTE